MRSVDLVPEKQNSYLKCPGGRRRTWGMRSPGAGRRCGFIGCLGDDDAGQLPARVFGITLWMSRFLKMDGHNSAVRSLT